MLTLHDYLPSQNGWKIRVLFGLLKISYNSRLVSIFEGESHTPDFLALNPAGAVPVLELEDGRALAESNAILAYLAEGTPFLPADRFQRAKVMLDIPARGLGRKGLPASAAAFFRHPAEKSSENKSRTCR